MTGEKRLNRLRWTVIVLSVIGLGVSAVALYEHVIYANGLATGPSFCNVSAQFNCEAVNASEWSVILGLPIASWGIFFFLSLGALGVYAGPSRRVSLESFADLVVAAGTLGSLCSIVLFGISKWIIGTLCLMCMALYAVNFLLLGVGLAIGRRGPLVPTVGRAIWLCLSFVKAVVGAGCGCEMRAAARIGLLGLVAFFAVAAFAPRVILAVESKRIPVKPPADDPAVAVELWRAAPLTKFDNKIDGTAFGDYAEGTPGAPLQLVEFADFQCPGCRRQFLALKKILEKYKGKYQLVFRNYPLDKECNPGIKRDFHQFACFSVRFSRCAGEQGKFWESATFLFESPLLESEEPLSKIGPEIESSGVSELGLDPEGMKECLASNRYDAKILEDIKAGDDAHLESTPSLWVNGRQVKRMAGGGLERVFDTILAEAGR